MSFTDTPAEPSLTQEAPAPPIEEAPVNESPVEDVLSVQEPVVHDLAEHEPSSEGVAMEGEAADDVADDGATDNNTEESEEDRLHALRGLLLGEELDRIDALERQVRDLAYHLAAAQQAIEHMEQRGVPHVSTAEQPAGETPRSTGSRFAWWVESIQSGQRYQEVCDRHTLVHRVERVVLIHRGTRDVLHHLWMSEAGVPALFEPMEAVIDAALRGGDARIDFDGRIGHIARSSRLALVTVVRGKPPTDIGAETQALVEMIEQTHMLELDSYQGDASVFQSAHVRLRACLGESRTTPLPDR